MHDFTTTDRDVSEIPLAIVGFLLWGAGYSVQGWRNRQGYYFVQVEEPTLSPHIPTGRSRASRTGRRRSNFRDLA